MAVIDICCSAATAVLIGDSGWVAGGCPTTDDWIASAINHIHFSVSKMALQEALCVLGLLLSALLAARLPSVDRILGFYALSVELRSKANPLFKV